MIVVDLTCPAEHRFEGWFASQEAFKNQNNARLISCPNCGSHEIRRLPSAPHLARATTPPVQPAAPADLTRKLMNALKDQAARAEDVGKKFPEEARRIHYGDAEDRIIRGVASASEALALIDEGINVLPVPPTKEDLH